jgi:hypothetical protein
MTGIPPRPDSSMTALPVPALEPGDRAVGFYVSVRTSARMGWTALALGPFDDHASAHAWVPPLSAYVRARHRTGREWWGFRVAEVAAPPGRALPVGTLNALACEVDDGAAARPPLIL